MAQTLARTGLFLTSVFSIMGRRKTVRQLQQQLEYTRRREAYVAPARQAGAATRRQPKISVKYNPLIVTAATHFTIQASKAGVQFFGGLAALGIADAAADPIAPRGFHPSQVHAVVADASPQTETARASGRTYIRYNRGTRGGSVQSTFSAPIAAETVAALVIASKALFNSKKDDVGGPYGRLWLTLEKASIIESGA